MIRSAVILLLAIPLSLSGPSFLFAGESHNDEIAAAIKELGKELRQDIRRSLDERFEELEHRIARLENADRKPHYHDTPRQQSPPERVDLHHDHQHRHDDHPQVGTCDSCCECLTCCKCATCSKCPTCSGCATCSTCSCCKSCCACPPLKCYGVKRYSATCKDGVVYLTVRGCFPKCATLTLRPDLCRPGHYWLHCCPDHGVLKDRTFVCKGYNGFCCQDGQPYICVRDKAGVHKVRICRTQMGPRTHR